MQLSFAVARLGRLHTHMEQIMEEIHISIKWPDKKPTPDQVKELVEAIKAAATQIVKERHAEVGFSHPHRPSRRVVAGNNMNIDNLLAKARGKDGDGGAHETSSRDR
jgi:heterodisulfide reductase subunit B